MKSKAPRVWRNLHSPGRRPVLGAAVVALSLSLAACGNGGSGGDAPVDAAGLAAATKLVNSSMKQPSALPISTPVGKPIPKGKSIAFISCGSPECQQEGAIVGEAAKALGWTEAVLNTQGTPESEKAAFDQVVRAKYSAALYSAIDRSIFASDIPALKANGTFVAGMAITDPATGANGIDYSVDGTSAVTAVGKLLAAWVVDKSQGKGDILYVDTPSFTILKPQLDSFQAALKSYCPSNCSSQVLDIPLSAIGVDVPTRIVAALRSNPNIKYVVNCTDALTTGLPAALKAAGLNDVTIVGQGATNLQYVRSGQEQASIAYPYYENLWAMVDAVARHEAGVAQLAPATPPLWLLNESNAPTTNSIYPVVSNVESKFEKLWGLN